MKSIFKKVNTKPEYRLGAQIRKQLIKDQQQDLEQYRNLEIQSMFQLLENGRIY